VIHVDPEIPNSGLPPTLIAIQSCCPTRFFMVRLLDVMEEKEIIALDYGSALVSRNH
jgi:hypothetical protein